MSILVGDRIKVIEQEIYGVIVHDFGNEVVIEDEDAETLDNQLCFKKSEVEIIEESKMRVTKEDMELWIGTDEKGNYPKQSILEILCELANGDYEQEQFKSDVLDYREV